MTMTDPSCRILTLSSPKDGALQFLQRLVQNDLPTTTDNPSVIPWTIANKYYTADVHFEVHQLPDWRFDDEELDSVSAILYTWTAGEPYRENVQMISQRLSHHDFEVSLAIRLPSATAGGERTEDDDIDAFLGSLGFEFIDARDSAMSSAPRDRGGVARAIDALSTIMWPSMVQNTSSHGLLKTTCGTEEDLSSLITMRPAGGHDRMQKELEALERWLDGDDSDSHSDTSEKGTLDLDDAWSAAATTRTLSPTEDDPCTPGLHTNAFDDDFTAFVSASSSAADAESVNSAKTSSNKQPPFASSSFSSPFTFDDSSSDSSGRLTPSIDEQDSSLLRASDFGSSYRSLGSVSDFENPEPGQNKEDYSDDELPSSAEIAATSRRIFGETHLAHSPIDNTPSPQGNLPLPSEAEVAADPSEADLESLDLQSMLSALHGFKEEIAGISDSRERKRAAARVALGLVYGLDGNSG